MEKLTMTVREAAETFVREGLERGLLPFSTGFYMKGSSRRTFIISRVKFNDFIGLDPSKKI